MKTPFITLDKINENGNVNIISKLPYEGELP
jgi:hypothetical protein